MHKFKTHAVGDIGISAITAAELEFGVQKSRQVSHNQQTLEQFFIPLTIVEFDYPAAQTYGKIRATLTRQGTPIGPLDLLIAAHALSLNVTLVTNNTKEFVRVPQLKLANWAEE